MATPTLFEIQCALMSGVVDRAARTNQVNRFPVPAEWSQFRYTLAPSGFEATYFAKTNADGTKEIVIAFGPTNLKEIGDIFTDIESAVGNATTQLLQAAEYYLYVKSLPQNAGAKITFTGHSLGGGLAALMGLFFNEDAVVFDPAPFAEAANEIVREAIKNHLQGLPSEYIVDPQTGIVIPVEAPRLYTDTYTIAQINSLDPDLSSFTNASVATRTPKVSGYYRKEGDTGKKVSF